MTWIVPKILVANDDRDIRMPKVLALKLKRYEVDEAVTGSEFHSKAQRLVDGVDEYILIVDNQMPVYARGAQERWCGFDRVLDLCRRYPHTSIGKRVIFLSQWSVDDLKERHTPEADGFGLLDPRRWLPLDTPVALIHSRIREILIRESRDGQ